MNNPVIEAMKTRRSCRKFKADPVPQTRPHRLGLIKIARSGA